MPNPAVFDPNIDPVVPGGLTQAQEAVLKNAGYVQSAFAADEPNAAVAYSNPSLPGGVEVRQVTIPAGTTYLYHPVLNTKVLRDCGNGFGIASDSRLKEDVSQIGTLMDGVGIYRFRYIGHNEHYVGVLAQEVQNVRPTAVIRGEDGYLRVNYQMLGIEMLTWNDWQDARAARAETGSEIYQSQ